MSGYSFLQVYRRLVVRDRDKLLDQAERQASELIARHGVRFALARSIAAGLRAAGLLSAMAGRQ